MSQRQEDTAGYPVAAEPEDRDFQKDKAGEGVGTVTVQV